MLYFKTKKGRLVIQILVSENDSIFMVMPPLEENRLPARYCRFVEEKIWKRLLLIGVPQVLEENETDLANYYRTMDDEQEFEQTLADQEWMMSMAIHHRKF